MPEVSVIIPTYNRAEWLCEAVDSVMAQTFKDVEIIVADDGSTDSTSVVLGQRYGSRVRYLPLRHTGLPAAARNAGLAAATGNYLAFLDSDDLWLPDKLSVQLQFMKAHPEWPWCYGNSAQFGAGGRPAGLELGWWQVRSGPVFPVLLQGNFIPCCTVIVKRHCVEQVGFFDEDPGLRSVEDYEYWLRLAAQFPVGGIGRVIAHYRLSESNLSNHLADRFPLEERALQSVFSKIPVAVGLQEKALAGLHLRYFRYKAMERRDDAYPHLRSALRLHPGRSRTWLYRLLWFMAGFAGILRWFRFESWIKNLRGLAGRRGVIFPL